MLPTIDSSRAVLAKTPLIFGGLSMMTVVFFMIVVHRETPIPSLLYPIAFAGLIGISMGMYMKYRSAMATTHNCFAIPYFLLIMEIIVGSACMALAAEIADRLDMKWLLVVTNCLFILATLATGAYREAKALGVLDKNSASGWRVKLGKYIDQKKYTIQPQLDAKAAQGGNGSMLIMFLSVNIPLLFELYSGSRNNAIFLAVPLFLGVFTYLNLRKFGPSIVHLYLLRKLEKESGRRFINADFEKIQELRRTFFLSRWLMKDYVASKTAESVHKFTARSKK
jgi:hypothetical protein